MIRQSNDSTEVQIPLRGCSECHFVCKHTNLHFNICSFSSFLPSLSFKTHLPLRTFNNFLLLFIGHVKINLVFLQYKDITAIQIKMCQVLYLQN